MPKHVFKNSCPFSSIYTLNNGSYHISSTCSLHNESNEEEEQRMDDLSNITVDEFSAQLGIAVDIGADPKADDFFTFMLGEDLFNKIMEETNCYACQKLADNEQCLG